MILESKTPSRIQDPFSNPRPLLESKTPYRIQDPLSNPRPLIESTTKTLNDRLPLEQLRRRYGTSTPSIWGDRTSSVHSSVHTFRFIDFSNFGVFFAALAPDMHSNEISAASRSPGWQIFNSVRPLANEKTPKKQAWQLLITELSWHDTSS